MYEGLAWGPLTRGHAQGDSPWAPLFGRLGRALGGAAKRGGGSPGGRCAGLAWRRPGAQGKGVGIGGGLRPPAPTHSTALGKQTLSAESLPFQEEGGDGKVTSPFLLKKSKGSSWAALQPPSPHSWTMHPCIFLLGHGRGLDFLSWELQLVDFSSPQRLNHAMCPEELACKALRGGSAPEPGGPLLWATTSAGPGALPRQEARLVSFLYFLWKPQAKTRAKLVALFSLPPLSWTPQSRLAELQRNLGWELGNPGHLGIQCLTCRVLTSYGNRRSGLLYTKDAAAKTWELASNSLPPFSPLNTALFQSLFLRLWTRKMTFFKKKLKFQPAAGSRCH